MVRIDRFSTVPVKTGHRHGIADLYDILQQQKQSGDQILHQLLRSETDRDADDTGTREQRRHIDTDFTERGQGDDGDNDGRQCRAEHRQEGSQPCGPRKMTVMRQSRKLLIKKCIADFPDRRGDQGRDTDGDDG